MNIANTAAPPNVVLAIDSIGEKVLPKEPSNIVINPSNELQLNRLPDKEQVSAVCYNLTDDRELQMLRHTFTQDHDSKRLARDWREEHHIFEKYSAYCTEFIDMLTKFQSMREGHLSRISVAKHSIIILV